MPTPSETLSDPNFQGLPLGEQLKVMRTLDPNFAGLSPNDQGAVIAKSRLKSLGYDKIGEAPEDPGFWHTIGGAIHGFAQTILTPAQGGGDEPGNGIIGRVGQGIARASIDQAQKAGAAWNQGEPVEAFGHALAAAIPGVGPLAAQVGEDIGDRKLKSAAADLTLLAAPEVAKGITSAVGKTAVATSAADAAESALRASAEKDYNRTLAPTTKANKAITAKVVPELIDRGVTAGTLKGLQKQAQSHIEAVGSAIGDVWDNLPTGTTTALEPIYDHLQSAIDDVHSVADANGKLIPKGPEAERAIGNISKLQQTLVDISQPDANGHLTIPVDKVRGLRQYFDDIAARAGRYAGKDLADQSAAEAHGLAADAIRSELAKDLPDIAELNKEYSFWKNVNQVVSDTVARQTGQSKPLGVQLARGAGFIKGGPLGAETMSLLTSAVRSPAWRTTSAVLKDRLADSIAAGNQSGISFYLNKIQQAGAAAAIIGHEQQTMQPVGAQTQ